METTYFIHNLGTLIYTLVALPVIVLIERLLYLLRNQGSVFMSLHNFVGGYFRWNSTIRVLIENYGLIALVSLMGMENLDWSTPGSRINGYLACLAPLYLLFVPLWAFLYFFLNYKKLHEKV